MGGGPLHIVQLQLQLLPLVGGIVPQAANALLAKGAAPMETLQNILQADFFSFLETDLDLFLIHIWSG